MTENEEIEKESVAASISALWAPLSESQRVFLADNIVIRTFEKNETIYRENQRPEYLMCLLKGKVKVHRDGIGGRNQIIRMISSMGFFGYRAAFAEEDYQTGASACDESTICMIPMSVVKKLIADNNDLARYFIKQLATMLGVADVRMVNLTQKHIRGRLAESLLTLKKKYGVEEDGSTLNIYLSREDLASLSNMTTSNAIRTLSAFASENLIALDGRKIRLIDEEQLGNISEMGN